MNTVALTGATGFIGNVLLKHFAAQGYQVKALYRPASSPPSNSSDSIQWLPGTLEDENSLHALVAGTSAVVHCAGAVRGKDLEDFNPVNRDGVVNLLRAAVDQNVPRFLLISSLAAREPSLSAYAASKRAGELALTEYQDKISWDILRPPAVYGPGDREMRPLLQMIKHGIVPIIGDKEGRFSLIYVDDLAEAVICLLRSAPDPDGRCFELHDGHPDGYTWRQISLIAKHLNGSAPRNLSIPRFLMQFIALINASLASMFGYKPMLTPGKVREIFHPNWVCDNAEISGSIGWQPKVSFQEGMKRLFYCAHPENSME